jgi:hypothetical protein
VSQDINTNHRRFPVFFSSYIFFSHTSSPIQLSRLHITHQYNTSFCNSPLDLFNMRFLLVTALAAFAAAQSTTSTSSAAPTCGAGQSTCNGVCFDSNDYTCCPSGLCAAGSYCGQDNSGNAACCAQNTAGTCSAASTPTSFSRGATATSGAASATSSASGSKSAGSSSTASSSQSTATSSGAVAGHAESWISNAVSYAAGGLVAAALI